MMHSLGTNKWQKSLWQPANPGLPGKWPSKWHGCRGVYALP